MADVSVVRPDLSLVLERITDGFLALDAQGCITYMNAEARRILQATEDPIGRHWLEAFPQARGRPVEHEYDRAMRDQIVVQFLDFAKPQNVWLEVKAYPAPDGLSVYFRDVSDRIIAQREAERSAVRGQALIALGRSALHGSYDAIVGEASELLREALEMDAIDIFEYATRTQQLTVRRSVGWIPGAHLDRMSPPIEHILHVARTGETFVCADLRIEPRARALKQLEASKVLSCIAVLLGTPSAPIGVLAAYHKLPRTFSTGDVRFTEAVAQTLAESALSSETNQRMAHILESMREGFVALDRDLRIIAANSQTALYWKRSVRELVGMRFEDLMKHAADGDFIVQQVRAASDAQDVITFETANRGRWFEMRLFAFAAGLVVYTRDITTRKLEKERVLDLNAELERRVVDRTRQLEVANKELESFSYSVSHDLRAPLRAIDGFSQVLVEEYEGQLDDRARGYLDRVRKAANRMSDLIDALLSMAKVARAPMRSTKVDLSALASELAQELRDHSPGRSVEVIVQSGVVCSGEPNLLRVMVANLMRNAWKFTRHTERARIEIGRNDAGEVFVSDNGAGFDMAYSNKLFGAFQRLHSADEYEGTGIGLATVARIVHRHGGTIRAEGEVGKGATFYVMLPPSAQRTEGG